MGKKHSESMNERSINIEAAEFKSQDSVQPIENHDIVTPKDLGDDFTFEAK